jgi:hypothetical protein
MLSICRSGNFPSQLQATPQCEAAALRDFVRAYVGFGSMLSKKSAFRLERRVWRSRDVRSGDLMPLKLLLSGLTFSQTVRAVGCEAAPGHVTPGS